MGRRTLFELLGDATVQIRSGGEVGTGFFIAPGQILTCAHVVEKANSIEVRQGDSVGSGELDQITIPGKGYFSYPDLALVSTDFPASAYIGLNDCWSVGDPVHSRGYATGTGYVGEPILGTLAGQTEHPRMLTVSDTQILPGMSGAPLFNLSTGGVCGIIAATKNQNWSAGGRAVPTSVIYEMLPRIQPANLRALIDDDEWLAALSATQRVAGAWNRPMRLLTGVHIRHDRQNAQASGGFGNGDVLLAVPRDPEMLLVVTTTMTRLVDLVTGKNQWVLEWPAECADVSSDGVLLALGWRNQVTVWDLRDGHCTQDIEMSSTAETFAEERKVFFTCKSIIRLLFSPEADVLGMSTVSYGEDPSVALRRISGGRFEHLVPLRLQGNLGGLHIFASPHCITPVDVPEGQKYVIATTLTLGAHQWRVSDGESLPQLKARGIGGILADFLKFVVTDEEPEVGAVFLYASTSRLFARGERLLWSWDHGTGRIDPPAPVTGCPGATAALFADHITGQVVECDAAGQLWTRGFADRSVTSLFPADDGEKPDAQEIRLSPERSVAAVRFASGEVSLWHVADRRRIGHHVPEPKPGRRVLALAPDGHTVVVTGPEDQERWSVLTTDDGEEINVGRSTDGPLQKALYLGNGRSYALATESGLWVVNSDGDDSPVSPLSWPIWAVDQAGSFAIAWTGEELAEFRDLRSGEARWEQEIPMPTAVKFSPDGHHLALMYSSVVQLRSAKSGNLTGSAAVKGDVVKFYDVCFSADSSVLAACTRIAHYPNFSFSGKRFPGPCLLVNTMTGTLINSPPTGNFGAYGNLLLRVLGSEGVDVNHLFAATAADAGIRDRLLFMTHSGELLAWQPADGISVSLLGSINSRLGDDDNPKLRVNPKAGLVAVALGTLGAALCDLESHNLLLHTGAYPVDDAAPLIQPSGVTTVAYDSSIVRRWQLPTAQQ